MDVETHWVLCASQVYFYPEMENDMQMVNDVLRPRNGTIKTKESSKSENFKIELTITYRKQRITRDAHDKAITITCL